MATQAPSQFAALLRQSKFASFDPAIAQAYTTFGGHANRGNFGLKRPLPIRFRNATVTVRAVDSRQQQTEWKSAEQQKRWIQMWDEVGVTPVQAGPWTAMLGPTERRWIADSDYAPAPPGLVTEQAGIGADHQDGEMMSRAFRNIHAMSEREFQRFLKKLRTLRPAFRQFLEEEAAKKDQQQDAPQNLLEASTSGSTLQTLQNFRARLAWLEYHSQNPSHLERRPDRYAGLTYDAPPKLQSYLQGDYHSGHIEGRQRLERRPKFNTTFAGMNVTLDLSQQKLGKMPTGINWEALASTGEYDPAPVVAQLRLTTVNFVQAPKVVGESTVRGSLNTATLRARVTTSQSVDEVDGRPNKEAPGSPQYVAFLESSNPSAWLHRTKSRPAGRPKADFTPPSQDKAEGLLNRLESIIGQAAL